MSYMDGAKPGPLAEGELENACMAISPDGRRMCTWPAEPAHGHYWDLTPQGMSFAQWVAYGQMAGYCSPPACASHGKVPATPDEVAAHQRGDHLCLPLVRLWTEAECA